MKTFLHIILSIPVTLILFAMPISVSAEQLEVTDFGSETPTAVQLIDALKPKTRRLRAIGPTIPAKPAKKKAVSLKINFELNSSKLTPKALEVLNVLGVALASDKLIKHRFRIEGHTDAAGNEKYNKMLSDKRAVSVKNYLASVYGIDPRRLEDIGMGETSLMDKVNPLSGLNRRVQIVNLGN